MKKKAVWKADALRTPIDFYCEEKIFFILVSGMIAAYLAVWQIEPTFPKKKKKSCPTFLDSPYLFGKFTGKPSDLMPQAQWRFSGTSQITGQLISFRRQRIDTCSLPSFRTLHFWISLSIHPRIPGNKYHRQIRGRCASHTTGRQGEGPA